MADLRKRYEELVQNRDRCNQRYLELNAALNAAKARELELADEAKVLGVDDITKIDEVIANMEAEIASELAAIEHNLANLDQTPPQDRQTIAPSDKDLSIDDLLSEGGSMQRRTK